MSQTDTPELHYNGNLRQYSLNKFSHLYIAVSVGKKLQNFSMRSLFLQFRLNPSYQPIISHSDWCHKSDIHFDSTIMIPLAKLTRIKIEDLQLAVELHTRQLLSSQHLGTTKLPLKTAEIFSKLRKPLIYFYKQSNQPILDAFSESIIGRLVVTVAFGFEEHANFVEPPLKFTLTPIQPFKKYSSNIQLQNQSDDYIENPSSLSSIDKKLTLTQKLILDTKIAEFKWYLERDVKENWEKYALANGWRKVYNGNPLQIQSDVEQLSLSNEKTPLSPKKKDILSIFDDENEADKESVILHSTTPEEIVSISPPKPIFTPVQTPVSEIDSILDQDSDYETEKRIDEFFEMKMKMMKQFGSTGDHRKIAARKRQGNIVKSPPQQRWSTPQPESMYPAIQRSPSLDLILEGKDNSLDIIITSSSSSSSLDETSPISPLFPDPNITPKRRQSLPIKKKNIKKKTK